MGKLVNQGSTLKAALEAATRDTTIRERYFTTPCAMQVRSAHSGPNRGNHWDPGATPTAGQSRNRSAGTDGNSGKGSSPRSRRRPAIVAMPRGKVRAAEPHRLLMVATSASVSTTQAAARRRRVQECTLAKGASGNTRCTAARLPAQHPQALPRALPHRLQLLLLVRQAVEEMP